MTQHPHLKLAGGEDDIIEILPKHIYSEDELAERAQAINIVEAFVGAARVIHESFYPNVYAPEGFFIAGEDDRADINHMLFDFQEDPEGPIRDGYFSPISNKAKYHVESIGSDADRGKGYVQFSIRRKYDESLAYHYSINDGLKPEIKTVRVEFNYVSDGLSIPQRLASKLTFGAFDEAAPGLIHTGDFRSLIEFDLDEELSLDGLETDSFGNKRLPIRPQTDIRQGIMRGLDSFNVDVTHPGLKPRPRPSAEDVECVRQIIKPKP